MKPKHLSTDGRRKFIKQAGITALGFWILPRHVLGGVAVNGKKFLAPSDTINLGFIGGGKQGKILSNSFMGTGEIKIVALAEVYEAKANLFKEKLKEYISKNPGTVSNPEVEVHNDFRTLLERKDVDAVVIATPDHWHAVMAVHAARAGKDIYCEKPMALTVREGRAMVNATRKYDRVFQTGNMQRSWKEFRQAVELIRNGYIGDIKSVKVNVGTPPIPYNLPAEQMPAGLDWTAWLGPNAFQNFNTELAPPIAKDVYPNWRLYKEFGGGMVTDWGAHMFDIAQWALDMDNSGPVKFFPPDGKDYKVFTMYYDNGIELTHEKWAWNNAVWFTGTEGELKVARGKLETTPVGVKDKVIGNGEKHVYYSENHYKDFLTAMRNRNKPICDVEVGHRTASLANIVNIGYELKRPLVWKTQKEKFKKDKEANKLLGRDIMNGWNIEV